MSDPLYIPMLQAASGETILAAAALAILAMDLLALRGRSLKARAAVAAGVGFVACVAALAAVQLAPSGDFGVDMMALNSFTRIGKSALLILAGFSLLISGSSIPGKHPAEYCSVILFGAIGMLFLISTENILMIFLALELTSVSLYLLTAFQKENVKSAEAGLKYFLFGGISAAFALYGLSLLYGLTGRLALDEIAAGLRAGGFNPAVALALALTLVGFGFKVAAAPFHFWAPDTYEGAPAGAAAFIASASKLASFFILLKILWIGFAGMSGSAAWGHYGAGWSPLLAFLSVASMVIGNVAALAQRSVRRLLAYSAVAHSGYMMLGILGHGQSGAASLVFYAATYGLATAGAFAVVSRVQASEGTDDMTAFAGLSRRSPWLAGCFAVFILSLAGIPPLAGFFGKFYLFTVAARAGANSTMLWIVAVAVGASVISLYYYLQVLKQAFVSEPRGGLAPMAFCPLESAVVGALAFGVVLFGCCPQLLVSRLLASAQGLF